jgi:hypothetical protein
MPNDHSLALAQLDRIQAQYPRLDGKASFLFAIDVTLLATIALNLPLGTMDAWLSALAILAFALLVFSITRLHYAF